MPKKQKETVWSFGSETDISTDVSALDNPVIKDAAQYDNSLGAVKCYGGNDLTLTLSNPIEISENAKNNGRSGYSLFKGKRRKVFRIYNIFIIRERRFVKFIFKRIQLNS